MYKRGKGSKIWENGPKFEEPDQQKEILIVFEESGKRIKKKEETDLKFEETDQQIEIFKDFENSGNGLKIWENGPIIWGDRTTNRDFKSFWKKR